MSKNIEQNIEKTDPYNTSPLIINNSKTKKEKNKRNRKIKQEKSKYNISSKTHNINNNFTGILSEIKQITIPEILNEKEDLYKILQSEIINIDKGIVLLNKKKKYYDEIIQKLGDEIQNEKKNIKKNEIKNKEYLYMENLLKDIELTDTFENGLIEDNCYYNKCKVINENLDYNYFLLNQKNNKNFLIINFFDEKNITKINNINKMEPNFQMSYEEFNNIGDMEDNFCLLMNNEINKENNIENKEEEKIIIEPELERNNNNSTNLIKNTPIKNDISEIKDEFTIINEVPAEEEETYNKKRKKISTTNSKNKLDKKDLDKNINKEYSNSEDELNFYLLKEQNQENDIDKKENNYKNKNKISLTDINKKYKIQDMGSDFLSSESVSSNLDNSKEEKAIKKKRKKKKKKKDKKDCDIINISNESNMNEDNDNNEKSDIIEISYDKSEENSNDDKKKKKRGRKKKKNESQISFNIEEDYPDPENLDNTALSLEMKKYGMKPQNKKKNIEILKSIYSFLKIKEMPEFIKKKLTTFDCENNENISESSDNDNFIGSKKNENMNEINDETKKKIIETIKDNKNIYEKILLFKEVSLKDIKNILNSKGIIVPNHSLSQLLINSGVILPGGWNKKK